MLLLTLQTFLNCRIFKEYTDTKSHRELPLDGASPTHGIADTHGLRCPTIQEKLASNGSPRATFETTDNRLTFLFNIPIHTGCENKLLQLDSQGQIPDLGKTTEKSTQKILALIAENPYVTTQEMADSLGITRRAVAKHTKKCRSKVSSVVSAQIKVDTGRLLVMKVLTNINRF